MATRTLAMSAFPTAARGAARRWRGALSTKAHRLHDVEEAGESAETPFIAILEVALFLLPIVVTVLALALIAYHLAS
jgi:hypothetical protein